MFSKLSFLTICALLVQSAPSVGGVVAFAEEYKYPRRLLYLTFFFFFLLIYLNQFYFF